ncbi:MAG: dienelactone hydrolase family protein [Burkholderiaceae bacterium]
MRARFSGLLVGSLLSLCTAMPIAASAQEDVKIPWRPDRLRTFDDGNATSGELNAKLFRPAGDAAAPFVVFLHGCGGLDLNLQGHWARFFNERGVGFLMVDSLATRGVASLCQNPKGPWASRRSDDAGSALVWLQAQPFARADRIALMGQSHGGGSALLAVHENTVGGKGFVAGLVMYPACVFATFTKVRLIKPVLALIGDDDNWTPVAQCETLKAAQTDPSLMEIVVYPGAGHSFDNPVRKTLLFGKYNVGEHPASRDQARERVSRWVDEVLKRP